MPPFLLDAVRLVLTAPAAAPSPASSACHRIVVCCKILLWKRQAAARTQANETDVTRNDAARRAGDCSRSVASGPFLQCHRGVHQRVAQTCRGLATFYSRPQRSSSVEESGNCGGDSKNDAHGPGVADVPRCSESGAKAETKVEAVKKWKANNKKCNNAIKEIETLLNREKEIKNNVISETKRAITNSAKKKNNKEKNIETFIDFNRLGGTKKNLKKKSSPASLALTNSYAALFDNDPSEYLYLDTCATVTCVTNDTRLINEKPTPNGIKIGSCSNHILQSTATGELPLKGLPKAAQTANKVNGINMHKSTERCTNMRSKMRQRLQRKRNVHRK